MNEELILDYLKENDLKLFGDDNNTITFLQPSGGLLIFTEKSACGHYKEQHIIPLLDIVAWVYSKTKDAQP